MTALTLGFPQPKFFLQATFALVPAMAVCMAAPVAAQENDWLRWGQSSSNSSVSIGYDREFIREWEKNPPKGFPTVSPANIGPTKVAIKRYEEIVKAGGWQPIPDVKQMDGKSLQQGQTAPAVALIAARLAASGDLEGGTSSGGYFDGALEKAVKRFQASNGLTPTGIVDDRTATAMNVPADARLKQLKTNLPRLTELAAARPKKYVLVNIPAFNVEAVEGDKVVSRHTGVVGKTERPTPLLRSSITNLNFNPTWTLPPTVVSKDLIPKGIDMQKRSQNVLVKYGIDAYDSAGKKLDPAKINWSNSSVQGLTYRQQPGKENPLGFLKINFDSANSVYMHDTPSETLFGKNIRAASSGCVRIANIEVLAAWLLGKQGWTETSVRAMRETGERKDVSLKQPVQLNFAYITAWATPDGVVQFRRDLYQKDGVGPLAASY
ncbi:MAG: L,D-transpeptidase family protein [Hyphomicrobiaceae bacterium]